MPIWAPHRFRSAPRGIRNDHLGYAVTWFGLAAVWAAMSAWLFWRSLRRPA
ncbi:SURF1 family cytochrome oxidase biogenesis protein [Rubellimicrobium thermophilum]|uniref:SURF1 family cytochrome oxidase biogenesis protein n=1 Tax=Rubellimicrobium thermophilum TaxID=295419 RepID=UPI00316AC31F